MKKVRQLNRLIEVTFNLMCEYEFTSISINKVSVPLYVLYHMADQGYLVAADLPHFVTLTEVGEERAALNAIRD